MKRPALILAVLVSLALPATAGAMADGGEPQR
jgi:hypothetical protein